MSNKEFNLPQFILFLVGGVLVTLLLLRFFAIYRFGLLIVLAVGLLGALGYNFYQKRREKKIKMEHENSFLGQLEKKIFDCQQKKSDLSQEIKELDGQMTRLMEDLQTPDAKFTHEEVADGNQLLQEFAQEIKLRESKIEFYEKAIQKLTALSKRHALTEKLRAGKETIRQLRENNHEDVVDLEALKSDLAYDKGFLESIIELDQRMIRSERGARTQQLQSEMGKLLKELEEL